MYIYIYVRVYIYICICRNFRLYMSNTMYNKSNQQLHIAAQGYVVQTCRSQGCSSATRASAAAWVKCPCTSRRQLGGDRPTRVTGVTPSGAPNEVVFSWLCSSTCIL